MLLNILTVILSLLLIGCNEPNIKNKNELYKTHLTKSRIKHLKFRNKILHSQLAEAIYAANDDLIYKIMLQKDLNVTNVPQGESSSLMHAADMNNLELVKLLIKKGSPVNYKSKHDITALGVAVMNNKAEMAQLLIDNGALLNVYGKTISVPLILAKDNPEILKILLKAGANPDSKDVSHGRSILYHAVKYNDIETLKIMIDAKADVNTHDRFQEYPLRIAVENNNYEIIKLLIKNNALLNTQKEYDGSTPLLHATKSGYTDIVKLLIHAGADVGIADKYGNTPYSSTKNKELLKLIIMQR